MRPRRNTAAKQKLPHYLVELIRVFRKHPTKAEVILWECLRDRRLTGFKFRRQHPIGRYVADFYCHEARLIIEVDGEIHVQSEQREYDRVRQAELEAQGLKVLRFKNDRVLFETEQVLKEIANNLPSPAGRGAGGEGSAPWGEASAARGEGSAARGEGSAPRGEQ